MTRWIRWIRLTDPVDPGASGNPGTAVDEAAPVNPNQPRVTSTVFAVALLLGGGLLMRLNRRKATPLTD